MNKIDNSKITLYISGQMSGLADHGVPAFDHAAKQLTGLGFKVINPADNDGRSRNRPWEDYMEMDILNLRKVDGIVMLPGWEQSTGATIEVLWVQRTGKPVFELVAVLEHGFNTEYQMHPWVKTGVQNKDKQSGGTKHDSEKLRMDLIPVSSELALAEVLSFGSLKYSDRNWENGFKWSRVYGAARRHLAAWFSGENNDPESNINHLKHCLCNIAFLIEFLETHPELDDRPVKQVTK